MDFVEIKIILKDEAKKENKEFFIRGYVNRLFCTYDYSALDIKDGILVVQMKDLISNKEDCCHIKISDIDIEKTMSLYPDADFVNMNNDKIAQGKIFHLKDDLDKNFDGYRKWTSNMAKGKAVTVKNVFDDGKSFNIEGGNPRTCYSIDMIDESKKLYSAAQIRFTLISIYLHLEETYNSSKNREKRETPNYREWDANRTKVKPPPRTNYTLPFISAILSFLVFLLILNISKL